MSHHWINTELRLSDAERRAAVRGLHREHKRGRIDANELDERLDAVATARTHGDIAPVFFDLAASPVDYGRRSRRAFPFWFRFPLVPLVIVGIVIAATGHVPWVPIIAIGVLVLVFAPWRRRRWAGRGWVC